MSVVSVRGNTAPCLCGVGFFTVWLFIAYYKPLLYDLPTSQYVLTSPASYVSGVVAVVLLLALVFAHLPLQTLLSGRRVFSLYMVCMTLVAIGATAAESALPLDSGGGLVVRIALRLASTGLLLGWFSVFSQVCTSDFLKALPFVLAFTFLLSAIAASFVPQHRWALLALLAAFNCLATIAAHGKLLTGVPSSPRASRSALAKALASIFAISLFVGILCGLSRFVDPEEKVLSLYNLFALMLSLILVALAIAIGMHEKTRKGVLGWSQPLVLSPLAILALAAAVIALTPASATVAANAYCRSSIEIAMLVCSLVVSRELGSHPVMLFLLGQASLLVGNILGVPIAVALSDAHVENALVFGTAVLIAACESVFVFVLVFLSARRNPPSDSSSTDIVAAEPFQESVILRYSQKLGLSSQEAKVLALTLHGRNRQRIAEEMYLSPGTVSSYLRRVYDKAGVRTRQELIDHYETYACEAHPEKDAGGREPFAERA
ncbi:hypothetical protein B5F40_03180 [Gordonibacter sp. An230]|uniref:helix-turn-helix transcriptional regulator n=1 Tax=Gordonibacter sp. An230 TaxID=1965592 RepID=UPI000B55D800|nr:helix-turn-helix transcriptional regulator [Gordonibacter sp. An230]OUO91455.1 hypothetical protein B5F40_03180 [Gordonibacter sp. An230]